MNVADQIGRAARRFPDALAVISGDFRLTFKELDERSDRLAHALMGLGLSKGDRVATFLENSHHCVEVDFALSKAGLIRVSLNPRSTADDLEYVLRNCESGVLIYGGSFDATVAKAAPSAAQVQHWIRVEEPGDAPRDAVSTGNYETLIAGAAAGPVAAEIDPEDIYCLFYTSGTTGRPKGVMLSHRAILQVSFNLLMEVGPQGPGEKILLMQPMSHGAGFFALPWFMRGGTSVIMRHFDAREVIRLAAEHEIETIKLVPTMVQKMLGLPAEDMPDLPKLRQIIYGASPMPTQALRDAMKIFGRRFVQIYGQSEAPVTLSTLSAADHDPDGPKAERLASAGVPFPAIELKIVDNAGNEVPTGTPGEVVLRAPQLMSGYWKLPELTRETVRNGWLHTKDLGRLDAEGFLYLLGRTDEMIISGGYNIAPREVEEALYLHPAVQEVAVVGEADEVWGSAVVAYVSLRNGESYGDIQEFGKSRLGFKTPKRFYRVSELPKSPNGKIQKSALTPALALQWDGGRE